MLHYRQRKLKIIHGLAVSALLVCIPACQPSAEDEPSVQPPQTAPTEVASSPRGWEAHVESAWEGARKAVDAIGPLKERVTESATEEYSKLYAMEYHVVQIPLSESPTAMEMELGRLGRDRWDCFHVIESEDHLRLVCKRRPDTWLRYVEKLSPVPLP